MWFVFYTNSVSAHQLPLAHELVARLGADNYRYIYTGDRLQGGGQETAECEPWIVKQTGDPEVGQWLESADVLMTGGLRPIELIERRAANGLKTFYYTERWFKPIPLLDLRLPNRLFLVRLPGAFRLLVPSYRRMAKRFVAWLKSDPRARCLAVGLWARRDMMRIGVPTEKIIDWGYFVEAGTCHVEKPKRADGSSLKVLWVGRMLDWKRVDTIVRAVARANEAAMRGTSGEGRRRDFCSLTLVGDGPERMRLEQLAKRLQIQQCTFLPPVPIGQVRELMRQHDVYVLSSNAQEGWGAALNEAMEEGMICFGTYEAGASAAMLPESHLFHTGDDRRLAALLGRCAFYSDAPAARRAGGAFVPIPPACTPKGAADILMESLA